MLKSHFKTFLKKIQQVFLRVFTTFITLKKWMPLKLFDVLEQLMIDSFLIKKNPI